MKEMIRDILIAVLIVGAITFVIKPTIVKQDSMVPTLNENNYLFINKLAYKWDEHPGYGDIVVFESGLTQDDGSGNKLLIKRVIGVEGDTIDIHDGVVYRNGEALQEDYTRDGYTTGEVDSLIIPQDKVFVMGDNREISLDSRDPSVGPITEESILGKVFIRLYPFSQISLF